MSSGVTASAVKKDAAEFSQSESVQRCRSVKESKLKAMFALSKFADEEVTIHAGNLEETRQRLRTQLFEQRAQDQRQEQEARDLMSSHERKTQLADMVDRLHIMRRYLRFQEEARDRNLSFKSTVRNKRAAFRSSLARTEQRQEAERNELLLSQRRVTNTIERVRAIEMAGIKDLNEFQRKKKESELAIQESRMRQQKEIEFLRESQLCKIRHLTAVNELEISNAEELEEIQAQHKLDEFQLQARQLVEEREVAAAVERQRAGVENEQLQTRQRAANVQMLKGQRKHANAQLKAEKALLRAREKMTIAENPIIKADPGSTDADGEPDSEDVSRSQSLSVMSELSVPDSDNGTNAEDGGAGTEGATEGAPSETGGIEEAAFKEAQSNTRSNKLAANAVGGSDEQREVASILFQGQERQRNLAQHHKKLMSELKAEQRNHVALKNKEHRRKMQELHKEHEEEFETLKQEQAQIMEDLVASQVTTMSASEISEVSKHLEGLSLPGYMLDAVSRGATPGPAALPAVTVISIELPGLDRLAAESSSAPRFFAAAARAQARVDEVVRAASDKLYCARAAGGTWLLCTGLQEPLSMAVAAGGEGHKSSAGEGTEEAVEGVYGSMEVHRGGDDDDSQVMAAGGDARAAVAFAEAVLALNFDGDDDDDEVEEKANDDDGEPVHLARPRVGVHTGAAVAGLVGGSKACRFVLSGEAVDTCLRLCRAAAPGELAVSEATQRTLDGS
ncbi:hypothetical protein HK405_009016, partial [Cladochytrium tenue]